MSSSETTHEEIPATLGQKIEKPSLYSIMQSLMLNVKCLIEIQIHTSQYLIQYILYISLFFIF